MAQQINLDKEEMETIMARTRLLGVALYAQHIGCALGFFFLEWCLVIGCILGVPGLVCIAHWNDVQ
jgi:hypothetical protein